MDTVGATITPPVTGVTEGVTEDVVLLDELAAEPQPIVAATSIRTRKMHVFRKMGPLFREFG